MTSLDEVVDDLYGGPPDRFVSARDAAARAARADGDRALAGQIAALRKPTVAAWLVNLLVRDDAELAGQLVALGEGLREAERTLDGVALRDLSRQRRALVSSLVARARSLATKDGHRVGDAALQEVDATLTAALADADVARAVTSGRLTEGQQYVGFGAADVSVAGPAPHVAARPRARDDGTGRGRSPAGKGAAAPRPLPVEDEDRPPAARAVGRGTATPAMKDSAAADKERRQAEQRRRAAEQRRRAADKAWQEATDALDRAQADADAAIARRDQRRADLDGAERAAQEASDLVAELTEALADLRRRLSRAQKDVALTEKRVGRTESALHDDERAAVAAQHTLRRAQRDLDRAEEARQAAADD